MKMKHVRFSQGRTFKCDNNHLTTINAMNTDLGVDCHQCLHPNESDNGVTYRLKMNNAVIEEEVI